MENFIQYCSVEFWWLTFWHNYNEVLQTKIWRISGVYSKPIDRKLQNVTQRGVGQLSMTGTMDVFLEPVLLFFWIKRKYKSKMLKNFSSKNTFPQSPKITKKCSSKCNGYRSAINIPQNFGHNQNKSFNLYTRQI